MVASRLPECTDKAERYEVRGSTARSRTEAFAAAAHRCAEPCPEIDEAVVLAALMAREREQCTALGGGVAIPHATVEGLDAAVVLDVTFDRPVEWGDDELVTHAFVILVPPGQHQAHLELTADAVRRAGEAS